MLILIKSCCCPATINISYHHPDFYAIFPAQISGDILPKRGPKREIQNCLKYIRLQILYSFCLGGCCLWVTFPHFRHLGCSGRPCPLADLGDYRILRDGDSITALDIFTVALPCFGFVCLFVRFLYWRLKPGIVTLSRVPEPLSPQPFLRIPS